MVHLPARGIAWCSLQHSLYCSERHRRGCGGFGWQRSAGELVDPTSYGRGQRLLQHRLKWALGQNACTSSCSSDCGAPQLERARRRSRADSLPLQLAACPPLADMRAARFACPQPGEPKTRAGSFSFSPPEAVFARFSELALRFSELEQLAYDDSGSEGSYIPDDPLDLPGDGDY